MGFFKSVRHDNRPAGNKRRVNFRREPKTAAQSKRAKFDGQRQKSEKKTTLTNEEISSSSEAESIGDEQQQIERHNEENEYEEDSQTVAYREAKQLLESLKTERDEQEEDEEDEDAEQSVAQRLRQETLVKQAKLHKAIASHMRFGAQAQQRMVTHRGHRLAPICLCFSANGNLLISCSKDGTVVKFDLTKRCRTGILRPASKDCSNAKKRGKRNSADIRHGQLQSDGCADDTTPASFDLSPALCCAISPDDQYLVTGSVDGSVRVWLLDTLTPVRLLSGHRGRVTALRFRRQCAALELFSASADKTIKVWSLDEMGIVNTLYGHQDGVQQLDILQWPRLISCGGMDKSCRLFKVLEDSHLVFNGFAECVSIDCVAMINEEHFVSGSVDGSLYVWTTARKKPVCVRRIAHNGAVPPASSANKTAAEPQQKQHSQTLSSSSTVPPTAQGSISVIMPTNGGITAPLSSPSIDTESSSNPHASSLSLSTAVPCSSSASLSTPCRWICAVATLPYTDLVASGSADGWLRLWCVGQNYKSIEPVDAFHLPGFINDICFSPDGNWLACAVGQEHKAGRWWTQRGPWVHNRVVVVPISSVELPTTTLLH